MFGSVVSHMGTDGHRNEVFGAVVIPNLIPVVDNFTNIKGASGSLLPYQDVLKYPTPFLGVGMVGAVQEDIAILDHAACPVRVGLLRPAALRCPKEAGFTVPRLSVVVAFRDRHPATTCTGGPAIRDTVERSIRVTVAPVLSEGLRMARLVAQFWTVLVPRLRIDGFPAAARAYCHRLALPLQGVYHSYMEV